MEDNNLNAYPQSAVSDFAASMETPDLRNWFSSYVYQSPELTSSCCFEDSLPIDGELKDSGLYVEDSEEENTRTDYLSGSVKKSDIDGPCLHEPSDECDLQHKEKVPEYSDSLSSEPPDVRNWFSSYEYESPTIDTAEIGGSPPSIMDGDETEGDFTQKGKIQVPSPIRTAVDILPDSSKHKVVFGTHMDLIGCVKNEIDSEHQENGLEHWKSDLPSESKKLFNLGGIFPCAVKAAVNETLDADPTKEHMYPRLKDNSTMEKIKQEAIESTSCYNHKKSATKTSSPIKLSERNPGWVLPNSKSKRGNSGKLLNDGFTPTTKISENENEKNATKVKHERGEKSVLQEVDDDMMKNHKPLMEISNVWSSGSNEIAGKWRCPQKNKPCNGPPLKQLRLEKWIHRV